MEDLDYFSSQLGMSSSQLTKLIFFRGVGLNHQPAIYGTFNYIWYIWCQLYIYIYILSSLTMYGIYHIFVMVMVYHVYSKQKSLATFIPRHHLTTAFQTPTWQARWTERSWTPRPWTTTRHGLDDGWMEQKCSVTCENRWGEVSSLPNLEGWKITFPQKTSENYSYFEVFSGSHSRWRKQSVDQLIRWRIATRASILGNCRGSISFWARAAGLGRSVKD